METDHVLAPVLVAVDRAGSSAAVRYGAVQALRAARPLRLVHVAPTSDGWLATVGKDALRMALTRADAEVAGRVPVHASLVSGSHLVELVRAAAGAALVVLEQLPASAHRRAEPSTCAAVAALVDVPVVVVPTSWTGHRRCVITVGLDPAAPDDATLRAALALARLDHAALRVLVVGSSDLVDERLAQLGGDACDLAVETVSGDPVAALREAAVSSDLLVLGRHRPHHVEGSRLGAVGRALLHDPACPVLLTAPGHAHHRPGAPETSFHEEETLMFARLGDRIVIRSAHLGGPVRDGEIIEVEHEDGRPPYRVRWSDNGHESLFFPGPDAFVEPLTPGPGTDRQAHAG